MVADRNGSILVPQYIEAGIGLVLLALLIAFIPTLYQSFQRREYAVSRLTVRAGIPATPWGVLEIAASVDSYQRLDELWREWEAWFIDVGETHTTLVILNYYRSPNPDQTWIGSAARVLDAAALFQAAVDAEPSPTAGLCIRAGWLSLRRIADYFKVPYPTDLHKNIPISISREEFEIVLDRLARVGVPILADRDVAVARLTLAGASTTTPLSKRSMTSLRVQGRTGIPRRCNRWSDPPTCAAWNSEGLHDLARKRDRGVKPSAHGVTQLNRTAGELHQLGHDGKTKTRSLALVVATAPKSPKRHLTFNGTESRSVIDDVNLDVTLRGHRHNAHAATRGRRVKGVREEIVQYLLENVFDREGEQLSGHVNGNLEVHLRGERSPYISSFDHELSNVDRNEDGSLRLVARESEQGVDHTAETIHLGQHVVEVVLVRDALGHQKVFEVQL